MTEKKTARSRIQTMLLRQKRSLLQDKAVAVGVTLGMLICISGLV